MHFSFRFCSKLLLLCHWRRLQGALAIYCIFASCSVLWRAERSLEHGTVTSSAWRWSLGNRKLQKNKKLLANNIAKTLQSPLTWKCARSYRARVGSMGPGEEWVFRSRLINVFIPCHKIQPVIIRESRYTFDVVTSNLPIMRRAYVTLIVLATVLSIAWYIK